MAPGSVQVEPRVSPCGALEGREHSGGYPFATSPADSGPGDTLIIIEGYRDRSRIVTGIPESRYQRRSLIRVMG
jgi:hypothetical protein